MQGQKRDSVINSFPYPKTLGVSQISVCSLQYDTDGMLTLKTSTDQVLQSPSADSRENGSKDTPRACSHCRARSSVQPRVYTAANSRGAWAHLTLVFSPSALSKQEKDHTQVGFWDQVWQAALVHGHVGVLMSDPPRQKMLSEGLETPNQEDPQPTPHPGCTVETPNGYTTTVSSILPCCTHKPTFKMPPAKGWHHLLLVAKPSETTLIHARLLRSFELFTTGILLHFLFSSFCDVFHFNKYE